jgi:hypothetical protein
MKSKILFLVLLIAIGISVYLTYERSFVTRDFEIVNSEETTPGTVDEATQGQNVPTDSPNLQVGAVGTK